MSNKLTSFEFSELLKQHRISELPSFAYNFRLEKSKSFYEWIGIWLFWMEFLPEDNRRQFYFEEDVEE